MDLGNPGNIADREDDFFLHFLADSSAADLDLVAVDRDLQTLGIEAQILDLSLQNLFRRHFRRFGG